MDPAIPKISNYLTKKSSFQNKFSISDGTKYKNVHGPMMGDLISLKNFLSPWPEQCIVTVQYTLNA